MFLPFSLFLLVSYFRCCFCLAMITVYNDFHSNEFFMHMQSRGKYVIGSQSESIALSFKHLQYCLI